MITKTDNPNERRNNGIIEKQLGPYWIPSELVKSFKLKCVNEERDAQHVMHEIMRNYLIDTNTQKPVTLPPIKKPKVTNAELATILQTAY